MPRIGGTASISGISWVTSPQPGADRTADETADGNAERPAGRHLIRTYEYKNAVDADGNHQSSGVESDVPWVAITPVVNAIRVLERMVPDGSLLFDHRAHDLRHHRPGTGSLKTVRDPASDHGLRGLGEQRDQYVQAAGRDHPR
jgi:hypothetical protein